MPGLIRRKPVMGAVADGEAGPHPFDDAMKRAACGRREASFPETPPETPSPETPLPETPPRKTPQPQLGDFSRVYDFLSTTPVTPKSPCNNRDTTPVTPKSPCHNRDTFPVVSDGLTGRPPDIAEETPTAALEVAGRRRMSQSTTTKSNVVTSELSSETTVKATATKLTPWEKISGFADLPKCPELPDQPFPHPSDHVLAAVAQFEALKLQLLEAKLLREMEIDQTVQMKRFDGKRMVHIFIDMSNIFIGLNNAHKAAMGIPKYTRIPFVPLNFGALQQILERGRAIGAREVVGSAADPENISDLPQYFHDAKSLAYNTSVLRRVLKPKRAIRRASPSSSPSVSPGGVSSSSESGEYCGIPSPKLAYREQGVDEILQLKMGNTAMMNLGKPGVMVLATGDAEKAEYSDGFKEQVGRILKMGWVVELVSWKCGLSSAWKRPKWAQKWGDQFRVILLDPFVDDLVAT